MLLFVCIIVNVGICVHSIYLAYCLLLQAFICYIDGINCIALLRVVTMLCIYFDVVVICVVVSIYLTCCVGIVVTVISTFIKLHLLIHFVSVYCCYLYNDTDDTIYLFGIVDVTHYLIFPLLIYLLIFVIVKCW